VQTKSDKEKYIIKLEICRKNVLFDFYKCIRIFDFIWLFQSSVIRDGSRSQERAARARLPSGIKVATCFEGSVNDSGLLNPVETHWFQVQVAGDPSPSRTYR